MENNSLERALSKATAVLGAIPKKDIRQLSLLECTFMLNALPDTRPLAAVRQVLVQRLCLQLDTSWIKQGDAYEVYAVLTALWKYDPTHVKSEWLASAIQRLVQSEATVGGPYYTGTVIGIAANVQIAIFIRLAAKPLPNMERFLARIITAERFEDPELTSFGLLYLLAAAGNCERLRRYTEGNWLDDSNWQTPLRRVIALGVLKDCLSAPEISSVFVVVCTQQRDDGYWPGEPLTKGAAREHCSRLVTTALMVEALHNSLYAPAKVSTRHWRRKRQVVVRAAAQMFETHPEPLRSSALAAVARVCKADENFEITLLPQFFAQALSTPGHFTNRHYTALGLANLCVWVAYTLYDDFVDNEGTPAELPVANVAMRASLNCFRVVLPDDTRFQRYVTEVLDRMDQANAWEMGNCRFAVRDGRVAITGLPKYGRRTVLAVRAFAHALTPMAILAQYDAPNNAKKTRYIEIAFQHYLIARQLNDDLHDWTKDIQAGQASYVVTAILRDLRVKYGVYNMDTLLPTMQRCFRRTTLPKVCQRMLWHTAVSRQYFEKSQLLQTPNDIYVLLDNLELSARQSMDRCAKSQALTDLFTPKREDRLTSGLRAGVE